MWQKLKPYIIFVGSALAVGGLSALVTRNSMDNYARLVQPPFAPPGWLFPVVWTALFILMGIGAARVYIAGGPYRSVSLALFFTQLAVNFCWSIFFFRLEARLESRPVRLGWLLLLLTLVLFMTAEFKKSDKTAALLQIPYILWLCFAGYLNLVIYLLNG